jgi:hypothetical protein
MARQAVTGSLAGSRDGQRRSSTMPAKNRPHRSVACASLGRFTALVELGQVFLEQTVVQGSQLFGLANVRGNPPRLGQERNHVRTRRRFPEPA